MSRAVAALLKAEVGDIARMHARCPAVPCTQLQRLAIEFFNNPSRVLRKQHLLDVANIHGTKADVRLSTLVRELKGYDMWIERFGWGRYVFYPHGSRRLTRLSPLEHV